MFPPVGLERRLLATLRWSVATAVGFAAAKRVHFSIQGESKNCPVFAMIAGLLFTLLCILKWTDLFFGSVLGIRSITLPKLSASWFGNQWFKKWSNQ